jgi:hypothetical protein
MNLYAVKMAAVLMISTSTLLSGRYIDWNLLVIPLWVLLISIYILVDNLRRPSQTAATMPGAQ